MKEATKWIAAALLIFGGGWGIKHWLHGRKPHIVYRTIDVSRGDVRLTILATGTVAPRPARPQTPRRGPD